MKFTLPFILLLITGEVFSQDIHSNHQTFYSAGFIQVKEDANFGLVFRGPSFGFGMHWELASTKRMIVYEYSLGPGIMFAKDIAGLDFSFKPVDLGCLWKIPAGKIILYAGPAVKMQYDVQFYPDLQSGYDYWLTSYAAGVNVQAGIPFKNGTVKVSLYNSLVSLTSRTEPYTDPYFFDLGFKEVLKDVHCNMSFSGPDRFVNTALKINYLSNKHPRLSVSYVLDYFNYAHASAFKLLNQSLRISIFSKK